MDISSDNVAVTPSARQAGVYDIAPFTLQNIISSHISDLKILSVESPSRSNFLSKSMIKIGITGGIGSGKSTVCRAFAQLGVPVYDSDSRRAG